MKYRVKKKLKKNSNYKSIENPESATCQYCIAFASRTNITL